MRPCLLCLALFIPVSILSAQNTRQNRAVFFPVTDYAGGWQPLPKTLPECKAIAGDLESLYGFKTELLPNKNKQQIKDKLAELARASYGPQDQLLLFFSMHGHFDDAGDAGCLVPAAAMADDPSFDTWLLHTELRALVNRIPCEHILLVLDACYSGTFGGEKSKPPAPAGTDCETKITNALGRKSRQYLTAGGKEKVPADSDFARRWRTALGSRGGDDGLLSFTELQLYLSEATPAPKWGVFGSDLGGSFVLVPKNGCGYAPKPPVDPDQAACESARRQNSIDAWEYYLEAYPSGRCRPEALEERAWLLAEKSGAPAGYQMYLDVYGPNARHADDARRKIARQTTTSQIDTSNELTNASSSSQGFPSITDPKLGIFIKVPSGTFIMGCQGPQKDCDDDEQPTHKVTLEDFFIGQTEVTQKQWKEIMGYNPSFNKNCDVCPVENVSWNDIQAFLGKINANTDGKKFRLPTEAEWEYAAKGANVNNMYLYAGSNQIDEAAWYFGNSKRQTQSVKTKKPNELNLFDMTGNVYEWCNDYYGKYLSDDQINPEGVPSSSTRVCRGGSWGDGAASCRTSNRGNNTPSTRDKYIGFRLVLNLL